MEFFEEFSWAMPRVFADAIANCKFEEGDIIYDSQSAYQEWGRGSESTRCCIKVKFPRRTLRVTKGDKKSVAIANWDSEVIFELKNFVDKNPIQLIKTNQGRLFTLLWKGDLGILNEERPDPSPPLFLKDVKKKLVETVSVCEKIAGNKPYFIVAYDPTNDVSLQHHLVVFPALKKDFGCELFQLSPKDSGFKIWEKVSPVICTNLYIIDKGGYDDILKTLKRVLYKPSKGATKSRFRLLTHGILGPV